MENLEQPTLENLVDVEGEKNEQVFDDSNKNIVAKSDRPTSIIDKKMNSNVGSQNYGKFKDAESLLKAYNALQVEFTKKSQKLSELESEMQPTLKLDQLNAVIDEMANTYSLTEPFKLKLRDTLINIEDCSNMERLAEQNLIKLLVENIKLPETLIKDEEFLSNYVLNNNEIKDSIIKEYMSKLKSVPNVKVATNFNSSIPATPPTTIKTISQAGNIARAIIKKK